MNNLSLCWGSLEGVGFAEFLTVAAEAGFGAVTLNSALYREAKASGLTDADIGASLRDHGLQVSNIDPLFNWLPSAVTLPGDDAISVCTQASMDEVFHLAHVAGTDLVNAPLGLATPASEQEIVDCFAVLCERAGAEGLRISLEFMPFNAVPTLASAARIVERSGCSNGGIMFDCWHHHRGGGVAEDIPAVAGERIFAVQVDDALDVAMDDMVEETLNHRCLPGEGSIDLATVLANLVANSAAQFYDVEVFNQALTTLPAQQRADRLFQSASAVFARTGCVD